MADGEGKAKCPYCRREIAANVAMREGDQIEPGAYMVCSRCAGLSVMDDNLEPRRVTPEQLAELRKAPEVQRLVSTAARMVLAARHGRN